MINKTRIFALCSMLFVAAAAQAQAPISHGGANLTSFTGASGAMNNNHWNQMTGARGGPAAPAANFGNCDALIQRCAAPRCANGGCRDMQVAVGIVTGCVQSHETCRQYGDALVQSIAAQMVANSSVRAAQQDAAAAGVAAQANEMQMQQMQMQMAQQTQQMNQQMQQMQQEMMRQSQEATMRIEHAMLAQQQQAAATAVPNPAPAIVSEYVAATAAANSISEDLLFRRQMMGQVESRLDDARASLRRAQAAMQTTFEYAGCDQHNGANCKGPRRVARFRQMAGEFLNPYHEVLDNMIVALELAMSVGVDVSDILQMVNDSCSHWGRYWCEDNTTLDQRKFTRNNCHCDPAGRCTVVGMANRTCSIGGVIPRELGGVCQQIGFVDSTETVLQSMMNAESQEIIACASDVLNTGILGRHRARRQTNLDSRILEMMISTREPVNTKTAEGFWHCGLDDNNRDLLEAAVQTRSIPANRMCVRRQDIRDGRAAGTGIMVGEGSGARREFGGINIGQSNINTSRAECERRGWHFVRIGRDADGEYGDCHDARSNERRLGGGSSSNERSGLQSTGNGTASNPTAFRLGQNNANAPTLEDRMRDFISTPPSQTNNTTDNARREVGNDPETFTVPAFRGIGNSHLFGGLTR